MSKKKKKKIIAKRRAQAKAKKRKKVKSKTKKLKPEIQYIERPAMSAINAPAGFLALSTSQAIMEYAKPILDFVEKGVVNEPNDAFQLAIMLWNYNISPEHHDLKSKKEKIIRRIRKILRLSTPESVEFFDTMIQRKEYLFPDDIQPDNHLTMFMRKEKRYLIPEFNYDSLNITKEPYISDEEDEELVRLMNQMDKYISEDVEYSEWEDFFFAMEKKCKERFEQWLLFKGLKEYSEDFPFCVEVYLNFIYLQEHEDNIDLKNISPIYLGGFFADYVIRKVMVEPQEFIQWPPALKLFYNFLQEIGYIDKPEKIIKLIDKIEPLFIRILRVRYS